MSKYIFLVIVPVFVTLVSCASQNNAAQIQVNETGVEAPHLIKETIHMNNCGGKADSEQTAERSKSVSVEGGAALEVNYEVLKGTVSAKYSDTSGASKSQKLIAPAGTNMEFVLAWTEQSWIGVLVSEAKSGQATYRVSVPVSVELVSSTDLGCSMTTSNDNSREASSTSVPIQPTEVVRSIQPPEYQIDRQEDYMGASLDESVLANSLVCLTTGPIILQNTKEALQFPGDGRASAICWIGPQRAQAYNLTGSSLKHVSITSGDPEQIALSLVQLWGKEMTTRADGCGASYGPCKAADLAVIRSDGSVITP